MSILNKLGFKGVYCNNTKDECCNNCKHYETSTEKCKKFQKSSPKNYWCTNYELK